MSTGENIGFSKILKLNEGDTVSINTQYFYLPSSLNSNSTASIGSILPQIATAFLNSGSNSLFTTEASNILQNALVNDQSIISFVENSMFGTTTNNYNPDAYLVWMYFDDSFNFNSEFSGVLNADNPGILSELSKKNIVAPSNGYLFVYVINKNQNKIDFDNLKIDHTAGGTIEINEYYPYGMINSDLSKKYLFFETSNDYKFNSKELISDLDLHLQDFGFRHYDPAIARWLSADPLGAYAPNWTAYRFGFDNPIRYCDPLGLYEGDYDPGEPDDHIIRYVSSGQEAYRDIDDQGYFDGIQIDQISWINADGTLVKTTWEYNGIAERYNDFKFEEKESDIESDFDFFGENGILEETSKIRSGLGVTSTIWGGAGQQTLTKSKKISYIRTATDITTEKSTIRVIGGLTNALDLLGRGLGVIDMIDHVNLAKDAFNDEKYDEFALNLGKSVVDGIFIFNRSTNPLWIGASIGYSAFDMYTSKP